MGGTRSTWSRARTTSLRPALPSTSGGKACCCRTRAWKRPSSLQQSTASQVSTGDEGPNGSDYRPGNTFDRLENVRAPFTPEEWESRKQYRSYDLMKFGYALLGIIIFYRLTNEWPVVWCDDRPADAHAICDEE